MSTRCLLPFPNRQTVSHGGKAFIRATLSGRPSCRNRQIRRQTDRKFNLLIFGGSQGARAINQAVLAALDGLAEIRKALHIIHQTGAQELEAVSGAYKNRGFDAEVHTFIMDMPRVYGQANLLICRAGATSIAEMTASGRASVLIPYPFAANDHQTKNAEVLVRAGAAEMLPEAELTGAKLAETILALYRDPVRIGRMEACSRQLARREAAAQIVDECVSLIDKKRGS